jgi:hypothetical protein
VEENIHMPQNPVLVYSTEDGLPAYMHTVDAAEAVRLGDYTSVAPSKEGPSPEERASAMSRFKTGQATTHPELQTEEEREKAREEANEKAELLAGIPEGAQVVVMAPEKRPASATARSTSSAERHAATPPPPTPPTPPTPPAEPQPRAARRETPPS